MCPITKQIEINIVQMGKNCAQIFAKVCCVITTHHEATCSAHCTIQS